MGKIIHDKKVGDNMNENNLIYSKVFMWMFVGLLVTFATGYALSLNLELAYNMVVSIGFWPYFIALIGIAIFLSARIRKMSPITAKICFILYSFITGITFSMIFIVYEMEVIIAVFGVTSVLFFLLALYGYHTKKDVTKLGPMLFIALIGSIVVSILNIFVFRSDTFETVLSVIIIIVFLGFIVYDMKKIKDWVREMGEEKGAIFGAFQLYLDFINIFIRLLSLFGRD